MTFLVSPGVSVFEFDLTNTIPAVAATPAAFAGVFRWGPMNTRMFISSENQLWQTVQKPSNFNGETWFTFASYLAYGGFAWLVRTGDTAGNTQQQTAGNSTANAFTTGNTVVNFTATGNTAGIAVGQYLFYSNNAALNPGQGGELGGITVTSVNSTTVTLSSAPTANATQAILIFRDPITFSAVAQEVINQNINWASQIVPNPQSYVANSYDASARYIARFPGFPGNSLAVYQCDTANQFSSNTNLSPNAQFLATGCVVNANLGSNVVTVTVTPANTANATMVTSANVVAGAAQASLTLGDLIQVGNGTIGFQTLQVSSIGTVSNNVGVYSFTVNVLQNYQLVANATNGSLQRYWQFYNLAGVAPGQSAYQYAFGNTAASDQLHIVVADTLGVFSGTPGAVLETYFNVSRATDAKNQNNTTNYYAAVINQQSNYIWWAQDRSTATSATAQLLSTSSATAPIGMQMYGGWSGLNEQNISLGTLTNGFSQFLSAADVDIGLIMTGKARGLPVSANTQLANWLMQNIAQVRKDCVVFTSPDINLVVNQPSSLLIAQNIANARNSHPSTSYGFMDSGYKYMYDRYNDVFRWVPLNGDMAGLCAQTDLTNAAWWSPAGFNRGNLKNVTYLAWNPKEADRDILYTNGVNPVVSFKNQGTVLFGDKTLLNSNSAFSRINVRRLFIVLEKAIATASQFTLFEFNDAFTRSQFKAMVNPFLQQIKGQRGITAFYVRCDSTNNPPFIVQNNEFVADIFIMPNYSINWIKLNFINVPPTLSFTEAEQVQF